MSQAIQQLPLNKLIVSQANVRKTSRMNGVSELAASIKSHGLLQNLTVKRVSKGKARTVLYEVVAGGRRLAALKSLVKQKQLKKDSRIPCHIIGTEIAEEISLAENQHEPMHPADQYEAFAVLNREHGLGIEEIAARFGVTPAVVRQRLKLGAVSPKLLTLYREGEMTLDQLTAFTVTDDHARQEQVWDDIGEYAHRRSILSALTEGQVGIKDRRAVFVGIEADEAAGGVITRDLFNEEGGFLADAALLNRLVREKLQREAETVMAEGWKWVEVLIEADHMSLAAMPTIEARPKTLSDEDEARLAALQEQREEIWEDEEHTSADVENCEAEIASLTEEFFAAEDIARAGAFVMIGTGGDAFVKRGYLRDVDAKAGITRAREGEGEEGSSKRLSSTLVTELTAHRTAGLRNDLAQAPELALIAVTHALADHVFYGRESHSCLTIFERGTVLGRDVSESPAIRAIAERHESWAARLPNEGGELWSFVSGLPMDQLLALLAHCAAQSLDAIQRTEDCKSAALDHADQLAFAMPHDMRRYWKPTNAAYLGRVSKDLIIEAVAEGAGPDAARRISCLKKHAMAQEAERLLADKGWLPAFLKPARSTASATA